MTPQKPIYLTLEFYLALLSLVVGILVGVQMLTDDDSKFLTEKIGLIITNLWLVIHWFKQYRERQQQELPASKPPDDPYVRMPKGPLLPVIVIAALCFGGARLEAQSVPYKKACLFGCRCEQQRDDPRMAEVLANQRLIIGMLNNLALRGAESRPPAVREVPSEGPRLAFPYETPKRELPREAPIVELPRESPKRDLPREPGVREIPSESMPMPVPPKENPKVEILEFSYRPTVVPVWRPKR